MLQWLVEAAEQLRAFSAYFLCDLHVEQLQLDELYAVLRELKAGDVLPGMNAGASPYAVPSPIEGSGTA